MVFEELATGVIRFVNYGETILIIMLVWEGFKFIGTFGGGAGKVANRLVDWKKSPVLNKIKRWKGRANTAALNEYLEEQKATTKLDEAVTVAKDALADVTQLLSSKQIDSTEHDKLATRIDVVEEVLRDAKREYERVNRNTLRQERKTGAILQKMRDAKMDVTQFLALERNILRLHKEAIDEIDKAVDQYAKMKNSIQEFKREPQASFTPNPYLLTPAAPLTTHLMLIKTNLEHAVYELADAYKKQLEVDKEVQGIISLGRRAWGGIK